MSSASMAQARPCQRECQGGFPRTTHARDNQRPPLALDLDEQAGGMDYIMARLPRQSHNNGRKTGFQQTGLDVRIDHKPRNARSQINVGPDVARHFHCRRFKPLRQIMRVPSGKAPFQKSSSSGSVSVGICP